MKKEETKRICIGVGSNTFRSDFEKMLSKLQGVVTRQKIEEFGIELNTEILQDLIAGGENTGKTVLERLNKDLLDDASLPIIRRQKEQMYNQLLQEFEQLKVDIHKSVKNFPYILPEMYLSVTMVGFMLRKKRLLYVMNKERFTLINRNR